MGSKPKNDAAYYPRRSNYHGAFRCRIDVASMPWVSLPPFFIPNGFVKPTNSVSHRLAKHNKTGTKHQKNNRWNFRVHTNAA
jgi:hypothetical protein